jgi:Tol biopolymer transport system component
MKKSHLLIRILFILLLVSTMSVIADRLNKNHLIGRSSDYYLGGTIYLPVIFNGSPTYPVGITTIAFASNQDGDFDIYKMNPDGSGVTKLTNLPGNEDEPDWSPDGNKIAFTKDGNSICVLEVSYSVINCLRSGFSPDFSPDGTKIAFSDGPSGNVEIFVMNSDGSNVVQLTNGDFSALYPKWSPDGKKISYEYYHNIWIMNSDGRSKYNLTTNQSYEWAFSASWSPDSKKLVFVNDNSGYNKWGIYSINIDRTNLTLLTNTFYDDEPVWSPDGQKIIFMSNHNGYNYGDYTYDLFSINPDGSCLTRLTSSSYDEWSPDWNPVQLYKLPNPTGDIAFISLESTQHARTSTLYTIKADGTQMMALYPLVDASENGFAWSNLGDKIVFEGGINDNPRNIYIMNADGTTLQNIYQKAPRTYVTNLSWSPDDSKIVFDEYINSSRELFVINPDGSGLAQLTYLNSISEDPSWSPDGTLIGFLSNSNGSFKTLFSIYPDGSNPTQMTPTDEVFGWRWSWSPDGTKIAYVSLDGNNHRHIYIMNKDGTGKTDIFSSDMNIESFDWCPDGEKIVFSGDIFPVRNIYIINSDGNNLTQLTYDELSENPHCSWDSTKIAYNSKVGDITDIFTMNIDGTDKENITNGNFVWDVEPVWRKVK